MEGCTDATTQSIELKSRVQQQLVRQLLPARRILHAACASRLVAERNDDTSSHAFPLFVEGFECVDTGDLQKLGTQFTDLRTQLNLELGIVRLVGRQLPLRLIHCDEPDPEAGSQDWADRRLPLHKAIDVLQQEGCKVARKVERNIRERRAPRHPLVKFEACANSFERPDKQRSRIKEAVLLLGHRLEHLRRMKRDHETRQEHPRIDPALGKRPLTERR